MSKGVFILKFVFFVKLIKGKKVALRAVLGASRHIRTTFILTNLRVQIVIAE